MTKAGDKLLREALFIAADGARKVDPQLAAKYTRLMANGKHHTSALCHIAATLLCRIAHCMRTGQRYDIRTIDGRSIDNSEGRIIVRADHTVSQQIREARRRNRSVVVQKDRGHPQPARSELAVSSDQHRHSQLVR